MISIDEAQFFGELYEFCWNAADLDGKTVIVAGLDGDYLRYSLNSLELFLRSSSHNPLAIAIPFVTVNSKGSDPTTPLPA